MATAGGFVMVLVAVVSTILSEEFEGLFLAWDVSVIGVASLKWGTARCSRRSAPYDSAPLHWKPCE
jgi:hypothetical protein